MHLERGAVVATASEFEHLADSERGKGSRSRVLIVEDDIGMADNLREICELVGYEAVVFLSAEQALAEIREGSVGFIVTDHRLPGMSGAALLLTLRAAGTLIPSVIATAWVEDAEVDDIADASLAEVLAKPIDIGRLLSRIERVLGPGA